MSWSIKLIGTRDAVAAAVQAQVVPNNLPQSVADAVIAVCNDKSDNRGVSSNGIAVEGWGHLGGGYGSIGKLEVLPVELLGVLAEPVPTVEQAPPPAAPEVALPEPPPASAV